MQIFHAGDLVRARGRTWRVVDVRPYDACGLLTLAGHGSHAGRRCELLTPFDSIATIGPPSTAPRRVGSAQWRRAARALVGACGAPGLLQASSAADMDILPHQLEPAVAVLRGDGCRILLADEVGLGKTIQACVLISELRARGHAERVLILTPPGLRDQWRDELARRFHLDAVIADFRTVRHQAADLPSDVNPWTTWPVVVASIDYVKRPEVLRAVLDGRWDIVIVDEAHRVANDGDRRQAASALASRAGFVVLLTATPHSGDAAAFQSLCSLGRQDDGLLVFRRTRRALSTAVERHIHRLHVRSTAGEQRMCVKLDAFARAVRADRGDTSRDMWIALALLRKRAFSSAHALHLSVTRRLETLAGIASSATQLVLPLDDYGEGSDADEMPPWHTALALRDVDHERRLLTALADAARACAQSESKIRAVQKLISRIREPIIIFTEYRDTLAHLAGRLGERPAVLHGGLSRVERTAELSSFASGARRILLATDAAAEGLNLHHTCRVVVNLELPWNPMRLEQRIGRVDRIGQRRTVHAFHIVGAGTGELRLLDDLRARIAGARAEIGAPDPLDGALNMEEPEPIRSACSDVTTELLKLRLSRTLGDAVAERGRPLLTVVQNRRTRARLGARALLLWECVVEDGRERIVSSRLVSTELDAAAIDPRLLECAALVESSAAAWQASTIDAARGLATAGIARGAAIARSIENEGLSSIQPGLFDRRAHFAYAALKAAHDESLASQADRMQLLRLSAEVVAQPPQLRLVLVPRT